MKLVKLIMLVVAVILNIVACSGGGSSSTSTSVNEVQKEINTNRIEINKTKNNENKNEETQQEAKNNAMIAMVNDATAEINRQISQQNQESKHSLKIDAVDPDIRNFSYADYGYIDDVVNGHNVRKYFYEITEPNVVLSELPTEGVYATYHGTAYMNTLKEGILILNISGHDVSGQISFESIKKDLILEKTQLSTDGFKGNITVKEDISEIEGVEDFQPTQEVGTYKGILAGGETKTDMTFGEFQLEKDSVKTTEGIFVGKAQRPDLN
ncbi:hypothetical protein QV01_09385 [Gallibacterium genomosp. 3]|uniref:Transferrin-binding protein B C-lobe/N-lobe beta barrel domain-containing protein n=1 Tax=Gallibacterium genomosp. 3 TaxID=505345 RepID=A0A1A7NMS1_9PAST|nr:hypothetical protein [Gallibacterium genomosp. 3]OBW90910.1 hypothetical protein QV01_09385 [Gallibacterium genomosp. 3]